MTPFPYTVRLDDSLAKGLGLMEEHEIRHLPVKDAQGDLVGVISDRDIRLVLGSQGRDAESARLQVRDAFVPEVYTVEVSTPLAAVASTMSRERIGSALVTKDGRLAGIFTMVDACRLLSDMLNGGPLPSGDEAA